MRPGNLPDEVAESDPHREEVEERLEQAGEDDHPRPAVDHQVALEEQAPPAARDRVGAQVNNLRPYVRRAHARPTTPKSARYATWPSARSGSTVPRVSPRQRSTPCQSGVA